MNPWESGDLSSWLDEFVPYLQSQFGIGTEGSPYSLDIRRYEQEGFARFRLGKAGEKEPLIVDLAPGPKTQFGQGELSRAVLQPSAKSGGQYASIFGPEIRVQSDDPTTWIRRSPAESTAAYMEEVWGLPFGTMRGKWSSVTGRGGQTTVGSLQQVGPPHSAIARAEMASRVSVGFDAGVRDQSKIWQQLHQLSSTDTDPFFKNLRGMVPWKGDDDVTRLRRLAATGSVWDAGDFDWKMYGFGADANKAIKHASVAFQGGLRETVGLMRPGQQGGLETAQPGFVIPGANQAGYMMQNIAMPGQGAIPTVNRPGTAVTPATPIPGAMLTFEDVLQQQGIYGAFRAGRQRSTLITPHIRDLARAKFSFGLFEETTNEAGEQVYNRTREGLGGLVIPANETAIVGTYSYMKGEREITQPLRVTAQGREIAFAEGARPQLVLPTGFMETELGGVGHPGVFSPEEQAALRAGNLPYVDLAGNLPDRMHYDPKLFGGIVKAFSAGGGGEVTATGQEQPYLNLPIMTRVGMGAKSLGVKAGLMPVAEVIGAHTPRTIRVGEQDAVVNAILGEIKNPLPQFVGMMGAQPGRNIAQSLTELFPEAPIMGRYARSIASQQEQIAARVRQGRLTQEQAVSQWPGISQEQLARAYTRSTGQAIDPWMMAEEWRQRFIGEAQAQPEYYMQQYGFGIQRNAQWLTVGPVTPEEREVYSNRFMEGLAGMGITGKEAQAKLQEYYRFQPTGREGLEFWQMKSPLMYQTTATPVVPEDLWKNIRLGYEEMAALNLGYGRSTVEGGGESISEYLGTDWRQGPEATGFMPPHARAWRSIGKFYSYQFARTDKPMAPGPEASYAMSNEEAEQLAASLVPDLPMSEYEKIINTIMPGAEGKELLYHAGTRQTMIRPSTIEAISEYEGADEDMRAINRSAKQYYDMLLQWSEGGTYEGGGPMGQFARDLSGVAKIPGTLAKTLGSRYLQQALGGRFTGATGMGLHTVVMSQERMDAMLTAIGRQGGVGPKSWIKTGRGKGEGSRFLDLARQQVEAAGGLPALFAGEPIYGREGGVQPVNIVTPSILRQRGINYQEASRIAGGVVTPGGVETGGILAAFGPEAERLGRDIDLDPGLIIGLAKAKAGGRYGERGLQIPGPDDPMMKKFYSQLGETAPQAIEETNRILGMIGGEQLTSAGTTQQSSGYIEAARDIVEKEFDPWVTRPGMTEMGTGEAWKGGEGWIGMKGGMGVAYNFRRWMEAAMGTLGFSEAEVGKATTYGAKSYSMFLEQSTSEKARNMETFMNSIIATVSRAPGEGQAAGTRGIQIMAKPRYDVRHKAIPPRFDARMAYELLNVAQSDEMIQPEWAAAMFSRPGGEYTETLERMKGGENVFDIIRQRIGKQHGEPFDISKTPIGLVAATQLATRMTGELSQRGPYRMIVPGEQQRQTALPVIGGQKVTWRGEDISLNALTRQEDIERTSALFQASSRRGGVLRGEQMADLMRLAESQGGEGAAQVQFLQEQLQLEEARTSYVTEGLQRTLETDWGKLGINPTIHPSSLGLAAFEPGQAGIGPTATHEAEWGMKRRLTQVARDVFGVPRDVMQKVFPTSGAQARGNEFEAWAEDQIKGRLGLEHFAAGKTAGEMRMEKTSFGVPFRFTPDVMGVIPGDVTTSGRPELAILDVKHSSMGRKGAIEKATSPGYGLQIGAYAKLVREAAQSKSPEQFRKFVEPYMQSAKIPAKRQAETAQAWQEAALSNIRTGIVSGYTTQEGEFAFADPAQLATYSEATDWTNPAVQAGIQRGVQQVSSWYSQEGIQEIAPFLASALKSSGQWESLPENVRGQLESVVGNRPEAPLRIDRGQLRLAQEGQTPSAQAAPPGQGQPPNRGEPPTTTSAPMPNFDESFWRQGREILFGEKIPLEIQHMFTGGAQRSEMMARQAWQTGVMAARSMVGSTRDEEIRRAADMTPEQYQEWSRAAGELGYSWDQRLGRGRGGWRGPGGRMASLSSVERAVSTQYMSTGAERLPQQFARVASEVLGIPYQQAYQGLTAGPEGMAGEIVGQVIQRAPERFEEFYRANRNLIKGQATTLSKVGQAEKLFQYHPTIQAEAREEDVGLVQSVNMGVAPGSRGAMVAGVMQAAARQESITASGKQPWQPLTADEVKRSTASLERFAKAIEKNTTLVERHGKAIEEGTSKVAKSDPLKGAEELRLFRNIMDRSGQISRELQYRSDVAAGREMPVTGEDIAQRNKAFEQTVASQMRDIRRFEGMQEEVAPAPTQWARLGRRALGGWGLMYMRAMMSLPLAQASYGYQASEEYLQRQYRTAGTYGGAEMPIYQSPETMARWSQIIHGGSPMALMREAGAGIPAGLRDVGAGAMAGIGGAAMLSWLGGLAGTGTVGTALTAAAPWAIPIAAAGMAGISGLSYARHPERSMPTYATGALRAQSDSLWTRAGGLISQGWVGLWGGLGDFVSGRDSVAQGANVAAYSYYARQGISPEAALERGLTIPSGMENPWAMTPHGAPLTRMSPEQRMAMYTATADDPRFRGFQEQAADVMTRFGMQGLGTQYTMADIENVARANLLGVDTAGMAAGMMRAFRLPQTGDTSNTLEIALQGIRAPWEMAELQGGMGVAGNLPAGFVSSALAGRRVPRGGTTIQEDVSPVALARQLDEISRGPNADLLNMQVQQYQFARERGEQYAPNLAMLTGEISPERRRAMTIAAEREAGAMGVFRQARAAGLDEMRYYGFAMGGEAQRQRAMQAVGLDVQAQMYGAQAGQFGNMVFQGGQAQQLAQRAVGMGGNLEFLGMGGLGGFFGEMALQGPGENLAVGRMINLQQQAMAVTGRDISPMMQSAVQAMGWQQGTSMWERAMRRDPYVMTQMAQRGLFQGQVQGFDMNTLMGMMDINLQGQVTGLSPLTTSLQVGAQGPAMTGALAWTGGDIGALQGSYEERPWRQAAVEGLGAEWNGRAVPQYMQGQGGMRALQWTQRQISIDAQRASAGNQLAMLELRERYQPLFWNIQDQQTALAHRQATWGFEMQGRQFEMQGRQFMENIGLQRQQQLMQRQWTVQDWGFQDQTRAMQWGWRQEDFEANRRFMTGRQRKLAERQMERETVMHGLEGDQIERQRDRQKQLWGLEDERHEMTISHFQEQRELQEENMKKQKEFYEEGKKLRDEMTKLQRQYWREMMDLQKAAAGAQAGYAEEMRQVQEDMDALAQKEQDRQAALKVASGMEVEMTNAIIEGLNYIIREAPDALRSIVGAIDGGEGKTIPKVGGTKKTGATSKAGATPMQEGGHGMPGQDIVVGERGPELLRLGTLSTVMNQYDLLQAQGVQDRWQNQIFSPGGSTSGGQPGVINVYVGNERLAHFVLDTVKKDLEVR